MTLQEIADQFLTEPQPSADLFTAGPMVLQGPDWMDNLIDPWKQFGGTLISAGTETAKKFNEQLPQMLFDWGLEKLGGSTKRTVQTGPGTSTTYIQPANPGAAPANPFYAVLYPGQSRADQPLQTTAGSTFGGIVIIIAIALAVMIALKA